MAVTAIGTSACNFAVPFAGTPCPNGDADCDDGDDTTDFYCATEKVAVCVPGIAPSTRENLPPVVQSGILVTAQGATTEGAFTGVDPDSEVPVRFAVEGAGPSNGTLTLAPNGRYVFTAAIGDPDTRSSFLISVTDTDGAKSVATVFSIVLDPTAGDVLTWTGAESSDFNAAANWLPSTSPSITSTVFLPAGSGFSPRLDRPADVGRVYLGPGRDFALNGLQVHGDELFSASSEGTGTIHIVNVASVGGRLPAIDVVGEMQVEASVDVAGSLRLLPDAVGIRVRPGASLTVRGDLVQSANGGTIVASELAETELVNIEVEGDLVLGGPPWSLGASTLYLSKNLEGQGTGLGLNARGLLVLRGKLRQNIGLTSSTGLPRTIARPLSIVHVTQSLRFRNDFDVSGTLSIAPERVVVVDGTLTLRDGFRSGVDAAGQMNAAACAIAPSVVLPTWIACDIVTSDDAGIDAGVDAGDDGGFDAGFDAGVDGGLDAGVDAGVDGGGDAGGDAGLDAGFDAGLDAGFDAGVDAGFDAGIDAGVDGGFDAGVDAGLDAGIDAGVDAGPPLPCLPPDERTTILSNDVMVLRSGHQATMPLAFNALLGTPAAASFEGNHNFGLASTSTVSPTGTWTVVVGLEEPTGHYQTPVVIQTDQGPLHECLDIRVIGAAEPVFVPLPNLGAGWNNPNRWEGGVVPSSTDVVFFPRIVGDYGTVRVRTTVRDFFVETGAAVTLEANGFNPLVLATREIAFGDRVRFSSAQLLQTSNLTKISGASELPLMGCTASGNWVVNGPVIAAEGMSISAGCALYTNNFGVSVLGDVVVADDGLNMSGPAGRLTIDGTLEVGGASGAPILNAGELVVRGDVEIGTPFANPVSTGGHSLTVLGGLATRKVHVGGSVAFLTLSGTTFNLDVGSASLGDVALDLDNLCTDVGLIPLMSVGDVVTGPVVSAAGAGWTMNSCSGDAAACSSLASAGLFCP